MRRLQESDNDVLDYSLPAEKRFSLVGTATSDWQLNPTGKGYEQTDWGHELVRKQEGRKSGIVGNADADLVPRFDENYRQILEKGPEINSNSFRMSLDFGKLCPREGEFDEALMAHYIRVMARSHSLGMDPMVTLNHWTLPKSFGTYSSKGKIRKGPLEHPHIVEHFAFYVNKVADFLFDPTKIRTALRNEGYRPEFIEQLCDERHLCRWFISLNEPVNMVTTPYMLGAFPPYQYASFRKFPQLVRKIKDMHDLSHDTLHEKSTTSQQQSHGQKVKVGMAHNVMIPTGIRPVEKYMNWGLVDEMEDGAESQFTGIQYYFRIRLGLNGIKGPDSRYHSDHDQFGQVYPAGIYDVLKFASSKFPGRELVLSEFGFADKSDRKRPAWIMESVYHLIRAKRDGVNVSGALLWSLINNFEWAKGMDAPFGILDKDGGQLSSDDGSTVSSREVWSEASRHMLHPTDESTARLAELQKQTRAQLNRSVALVKA